MPQYASLAAKAGPREAHDGPRKRDASPRKRADRRHTPRWARLSVFFGAVLMMLSGGVIVGEKALTAYATGGITQTNLLGPQAAMKTIDGPVNILLLGMDERQHSNALIRTDSIIIVHIPASHDAAYLISIPRDTRVQIPAFAPSNFPGATDKITAAFAFGNRLPGDKPDPSTAGRKRGVQLTAKTINELVPGGLKFNAVAIINYVGFKALVDALGGVDMCIDERVMSKHYNSQGKYVGDTRGRNGYVYNKGCQHLEPWQALDYVRQRDYLALGDGDYGRQRHQQQFLFAMFKELMSKGTLTNPGKFGALRKAAGELLTLDLGGVPIDEWIFTFKGLRPNDVTMIKTNAGKYASEKINGISYETLTPDSVDLLKAVHDDTVGQFLVQHPDWIAKAG